MDGFVDPFVPEPAWPQDAMFIGSSWPCGGGATSLADPAGTYAYLGAQAAPGQGAGFHLQDGSSTALVPPLELHQQFLSAHLPGDDVTVTQEEGLGFEFEVNSALVAGMLGPVLSAPCAVSLADSAPVVCSSSNDSSGGSEQSGLPPPPRFLVLGEQPASWPSAFPRISSLAGAGEETSRSFGFGAVSDNDLLLRGSSCVADVNKYPQIGNARLHVDDDVEFNTGKMLSFAPGLDFGDLQLSQKELSGLRHLNSGQQLSSFDATRNPEQSSNEASGGGTGLNAPPFMVPANGAAGNGAPKPRVRARRGQATDPHSIAERLRREKISDRMKNLQELVPNSNRTDKASMLDEIIEYVKFLQLQVKVLSMSRLGATEAVVPLLTQSQAESSGGGLLLSPRSGSGSGRQQQARGGSLPPSSSEVRDGAAFEQEVAQLMESDMTTAMQYLQSKGLCLMPVALASAISGQKGASSAAVQPENGGAKEMLRAVKPLASPIHGR